jgi:hypothetical protein
MHFLYSIYYELTASTCFEQTCSSSGDAAQTTLGILCACYVCWLHQDWSGTPSVVCVAPPEDEQVVLETCAGC